MIQWWTISKLFGAIFENDSEVTERIHVLVAWEVMVYKYTYLVVCNDIWV